MSRQVYDVVIVGAGPAGIFAALELLTGQPGIRILILDKGQDIDHRCCPSREKGERCMNCSPCSILCGWGGAGAFSDGKLTLSNEVGGILGNYIGEKSLERLIKYVDEIYVRYGARKMFTAWKKTLLMKYREKRRLPN